MKAINTISVIAIVIIVIGSLIAQSIRDWCIALSFNILSGIDNSFCIALSANPIFIWSLLFGIIGALWGMIHSIKKYNLRKVYTVLGVFGMCIVILGTVSVTRPLEIKDSREIGEKIYWEKIKTDGGFKLCNEYLERYPNGIHMAEVKILQENILWDSAMNVKTVEVWKTFMAKYPKSERYRQAKEIHEKLLWEKAQKYKTAEGYNAYLSQYAIGKYSVKARRELGKLNTRTGQTQVPQEEVVQDPVQTLDNNDPGLQQDINPPSKPIFISYDRIPLAEGIIFEGPTLDGKPEGKGKMIFRDGTRFEGTFVNGKREGTFRCYKTDGTNEIQEFSDGNRIKNAKYSKLLLAGDIIYEGDVVDGKPEGNGKMYYKDKSFYEGSWVNGKREGVFVYNKADGTREKQEFRDGNRIK